MSDLVWYPLGLVLGNFSNALWIEAALAPDALDQGLAIMPNEGAQNARFRF